MLKILSHIFSDQSTAALVLRQFSCSTVTDRCCLPAHTHSYVTCSSARAVKQLWPGGATAAKPHLCITAARCVGTHICCLCKRGPRRFQVGPGRTVLSADDQNVCCFKQLANALRHVLMSATAETLARSHMASDHSCSGRVWLMLGRGLGSNVNESLSKRQRWD